MDVVVDYLPDLLRALRTTLHITVLGFVIGSVIGLVVAVLRVSPIRPMRRVAAAYTALMVNSPLLFIVFLAFYGMPKLGFLINQFRTAALATGLYLGGYIAEALRSGFNTVSNGQAEAARRSVSPSRRCSAMWCCPRRCGRRSVRSACCSTPRTATSPSPAPWA